uniref:G patch domain-containing protein 4 n=1 Tax=Haplochromis burtoni TaxID=8153 RepID=A0A3Q3BWV7_HAPBU
MAEVVQEKSRGLKFAEQQLLRHGWEHGKGLGRAENGISEAIKVKVKCDKGGVGHKEGEQFTFHWWDHVFNKASSSLQVESDQVGRSFSEEVTAEMHADEGKKKKKSSKPPKENDSDCKEPSQSNHTGLEDSDVTESVKKRKKCKKDKTCTHEEAPPPLKRKKKKSKD